MLASVTSQLKSACNTYYIREGKRSHFRKFRQTETEENGSGHVWPPATSTGSTHCGRDPGGEGAQTHTAITRSTGHINNKQRKAGGAREPGK